MKRRQKAHTGQALRIGLQLLFDPGGHFELLRHKHVDHRRRAGRPHDRGVFQVACQEQIVGTARAHGDAVAGLIDLVVAVQGRVVADHVGPFDLYIRRREMEALTAVPTAIL